MQFFLWFHKKILSLIFHYQENFTKNISDVVKDFNKLAEKSIDAFTKPDRLLAIEAISMHN